MKIKIKSIEIHNFLSYRDEFFDFTENNGMTLITGKNNDLKGAKNGTGKSSWALALTYGLFGELPYKLSNKNIPNRFVDDDTTRVCVYLESDNRSYKICSGMKKKQSNCTLFEIKKNGEESDITKSTIAETRLFIQTEILNCDLNLFMRTIFLNSDPSYNFYNLPHKDKKEFIDKLFDISIYGDMYDTIHRDCLDMEKDLIIHQNRLMILAKNSEDYKKESEDYKTRTSKDIETLTERMSESVKKLENRKNETVETDIGSLSKLTEAAVKISEKEAKVKMDIQKIDFNIRSLKTQKINNDSKVKEIEKFISKHDKIREKLCKDCRSIFSKHYNLETYENEIVSLKEKNENIDSNINKESEKSSSMKNSLKILDSKRNEVSSKINAIKTKSESMKDELKTLENEVNGFKVKIETLKNAKNPYVSLMETNEENIRKENEEMAVKKEDYGYAKFLEGMVAQDNLKKYIIKDLIGLLNGKIKYYLHRLGANYDIIFDENMDYIFNTQEITGAEFHNFSSGEQARISIATCFAFRDFLSMRNSVDSNILILDEFIDSNVDSLAIENIIDILSEFSKVNKQNVYLVSHRQEVGLENFDHIIQVEKSNNVSHIKYVKK